MKRSLLTDDFDAGLFIQCPSAECYTSNLQTDRNNFQLKVHYARRTLTIKRSVSQKHPFRARGTHVPFPLRLRDYCQQSKGSIHQLVVGELSQQTWKKLKSPVAIMEVKRQKFWLVTNIGVLTKILVVCSFFQEVD